MTSQQVIIFPIVCFESGNNLVWWDVTRDEAQLCSALVDNLLSSLWESNIQSRNLAWMDSMWNVQDAGTVALWL